MTSIRGIAARKAIDNAVYSDSIVVDVVLRYRVVIWNTSTLYPITSMMYPVQDLTESGFVPSLVPRPLANAASTYISMLYFDSFKSDLRMRPR